MVLLASGDMLLAGGSLLLEVSCLRDQGCILEVRSLGCTFVLCLC